MRKWVAFISVLLLFSVGNVYCQYSQLTVFHEDGLAFWLIVNGVKQNEMPLSTVCADEIRANYVKVKVIFEDEKISDINKNIQLRNIILGKTSTVMKIKQRNSRKAVMRFQSTSHYKKIKK